MTAEMITVALSALALIVTFVATSATQTSCLTRKIEDVDQRFGNRIDELDARLTGKIDALETKLTRKIDAVARDQSVEIKAVDARHEKQFDGLQAGLLALNKRVDVVNVRLDRVYEVLLLPSSTRTSSGVHNQIALS